MSLIHQIDELIDQSPAWIVGTVEHWSSATGMDMHAHKRHQLMFAKKGVTHVKTSRGSWILPPTRAIWISGETFHAFNASRPVDVAILYIASNAPALPGWDGCAVVNVSPLVRELILSCAAHSWHEPPESAAGRMSHVLLEQLTALPQAPLELPEPIDPRALKVAEMLRNDVSDRRTIAELAAVAGASARTIERLFAEETRMPFGSWRIRQRMMIALERLAYGDSVGDVAYNIGYESPSSFITAFRQTFGTTPARYFDIQGDQV